MQHIIDNNQIYENFKWLERHIVNVVNDLSIYLLFTEVSAIACNSTLIINE